MSKSVQVLFFATIRQCTGQSHIHMEVPETMTVGSLRADLMTRFPDAQLHLASAVCAVNKAFSGDEEMLPPGAEVAFFPPVSGGSDFPTIARIVRSPLDMDDLTASITLQTTGAVVVFTGIVRGKTTRGDAHDTTSLEYEAYEPMAEKKMRQIAEEIRSRWPSIEGIALVQRIGLLETQTPTVVVACSAAHRDTGVFEAARYGIDRLKEIVPVWKKEIGPNGESWVEGDYFPRQGE